DRGVLPVVPSRGSVGASGDLAPLAHLALPLVGEGEAWFGGDRLPGPEALERAGLRPETLQAKEGLSLVNGTQFMSAFAALGLVRARRLARTADIACALSLEALQGSRTSFLPKIHALRPLRGQQDSAANVLVLLEGWAINEAHRWCDRVQDANALALGVEELASISERRVERLVNPSLSGGLPPFLTVEGGLNSGFMIPQYV